MNPFPSENTFEKALIQKAARSKHPVNGTIELLPFCNLNCDMCYIHQNPTEMEQPTQLHTADDWISLAKQMETSGVLFLLLTGGEPLLFPDFRKLYLSLKQMGMILTINTNGTLLDEDWADFFAQHKPRRINITLYGTNENTYEKLCHYRGGYAKTLRAIKLLKERGIAVKINGSVTKPNWIDIEAIYQIGRELDIPVHVDTYMLPGLREHDKPYDQQTRLNPKDAALASIQTQKEEMSTDTFCNYVYRTIETVQNNHEPTTDQISCQAGNSSFAIGWQGNLRPCVSFFTPSVNVFETGFQNAWLKITEAAKHLRINEKCTHCKLRPICNTCAASAFWETGSYDGIPDYHCQYAEEYLRLLYKEQEEIKKDVPSEHP
ncbi:MAG: radical SAM protein [Fusicatenibacter sp.]